ncbi:cilia- and flagella-associated protein 119-like isoform X2 [Rhopilema esculentum]|uniref:cilia- and flagella-associated protein 119-like isoform X2 n=1 Tax=Rhopilema esculentum TaxID=499914 RepID=UPI0031D05630
MPAEVPLPKSGPTAQICVWADFTLKDIDELSWLHEPDKIKGKISEVLGINVIESSIKKDILVDLFYFAYKFGRERCFNEEQQSAFLSIIKRTHEKAMDSPFGNVDAAYEYFKELLVRHCMKRPPFCVQLYSMAEAKSITDYVLNTYFKHYKLYKYAFTPKVRLNLTFEYNGLPEEPAEIEGEKEEPEGGANVEITVEGDSGIAEPEQMENEDPPAVKELKTIINSTLSDQVQKLKMNMDEQLKTNEETLLKKISAAAGTERGPSRKSRKK